MGGGEGVVDPLISPDYAGWWQRSIDIVKKYWKELLILQAIGAVASLVLRLPVALLQINTVNDLQSQGPITDANAGSALGRAVGLFTASAGTGFLAIIITSLVTLATIRLIVTAITTGRANVGEALSGSLNRVFPLIGWQIVAGLIVLVGVCACVLPSIYLAAVLFPILPAVVLFERTNVISRCFKLFHGNLNSSLARVATMAAIGIVAGLIAFTITAILGAGANMASGTTVAGTIAGTVIGVIITAAAGLLFGPLTLTTYADMRARVEPLSTSVLAAELTNR
jgi:hypothetical protein